MTAYKFLIERGMRRTWSLGVEGPGLVRLKMPFYMTRRQAEALLEKKRAWIEKRLALAAAEAKAAGPRRWVSGEELAYLGRRIRLVVCPGRAKKAVLEEDLLMVEVPVLLDAGKKERLAEKRVVSWYKEQARLELGQRVKRFSALLKIRVNKVRIKDTRSLWGSSSRLGNLNFSWRILAAPCGIVDYLAVHECCHQVHMNHGKEFWELVRKLDPGSGEHKKWLRKNGRLLRI